MRCEPAPQRQSAVIPCAGCGGSQAASVPRSRDALLRDAERDHRVHAGHGQHEGDRGKGADKRELKRGPPEESARLVRMALTGGGGSGRVEVAPNRTKWGASAAASRGVPHDDGMACTSTCAVDDNSTCPGLGFHPHVRMSPPGGSAQITVRVRPVVPPQYTRCRPHRRRATDGSPAFRVITTTRSEPA